MIFLFYADTKLFLNRDSAIFFSFKILFDKGNDWWWIKWFNEPLFEHRANSYIINKVNMRTRLTHFAANFKRFLPTYRMVKLSSKRFKRAPIQPMFYHAAFRDKSFFKSMQRVLIDQEQRTPPGLETRIRDQVETFDSEPIIFCLHRGAAKCSFWPIDEFSVDLLKEFSALSSHW